VEKRTRGGAADLPPLPDAGYESLDWQVSRPTIERDTPFSKLAGLDRQFMLVSGNGLTLRVRSVEDRVGFERRIDSPFEPFAFRGDWDVDCRPADWSVLNDVLAGLRGSNPQPAHPLRQAAGETLSSTRRTPAPASLGRGSSPRRLGSGRRAGDERDRGCRGRHSPARAVLIRLDRT
jgi:hypothetical protein